MKSIDDVRMLDKDWVRDNRGARLEFSFLVCLSHCSYRNLSAHLFIYGLTEEYMQSAQNFVKIVEKNFGYPEK